MEKEIQLKFLNEITLNIVDFKSIDKKIDIEIEEAFKQAKLDPFPNPEETFRNIYAN